jgi:hypothetical protein
LSSPRKRGPNTPGLSISQLRERLAALEGQVSTLLLLHGQRSDGAAKSVSARLVELRSGS